MSGETEAVKCVWGLKRYGRFLPQAKERGENSSWKVFESSKTTGMLKLTVLESGHLLVSQAEELLEGFSLSSAESFLKIHQKSDSLLLHITMKTPAEKLQAVPDVSQESLSIKHLAQYFMGERGLSLPLAYHQFTLPPGDVEDLLRLCFLDSGFPAFVEEVENKLKALLQE
ncbi:meiotic recombination protein REC114 [Astyanax mexicanus]|uniref:Meiotic recombination protein REC114 n=1 Tax=Astyanax mexicanus TaxID=7994 RepID=A0A8T2LVZ7_ASTMX|nr:meiotic recombination protein REC114 [Astyanax mexicanus]